MQRRTLLASGAAAATAAMMGNPARAQDVTKVGFVYVGPVGDGGWTYEHDKGRQAVEAEFGDAVETVFVESVPEGPDAERVMTQMALDGASLIFTTSFGYMDPTINVAAKFPDVKFEHATGFKRADNVSTYSARFYEGRAVQGHIAGSMTKSNVVVNIGSFPIPEVIRGINSAYLHAKKVNPDVEFKIVWAYTWFDPAKEAEAATVLIEQGCDVILQHTDSTAPQAAAQAAGDVITFGQASDMSEFAPHPRVSSIIDDWAPYYIARTKAVMDGTWTSTDTWTELALAWLASARFPTRFLLKSKPKQKPCATHWPTAAITPSPALWKKQDGSDWLADGETADDGTLAGMNFYVEGIVGDIPS